MILSLSIRNLFRNFRRTIAILLTVGLGAGALFAFQGFIHGVLGNYRENMIHAHYGNGQLNEKGYRDTVYEKPWNHWIANWESLEFFLLDQEGVQSVFPRLSIPAMLMHKKVSVTGQGQGILASQEDDFFDGLNVEEGANLGKEKNGILLGKGLAKALNVKPGDQLELYTKATDGSIQKTKLKVTGIFHTGKADYDNRFFRIQLEKAQELLRTDKVESVSVGLVSHEHWDAIVEAMRQKFPQIEAASFAELDKVYYQNSVDWLNAQFHVVQLIIISIVLLGIFNTISTSILERKQEIGNLRANGESRLDIMKLILCEGALLGFFGCLIGVGLTYLVAKGIFAKGILMPPGPGSTREAVLAFAFTPTMLVSTLVLSVTSALVASSLAAIKVARMPIAQALRSY